MANNWQAAWNWLRSSPTASYMGKNAVNAALLSLVQMYHDPIDNNFHNWHGVKGILWQIGAAVLSREVIIIVPKALKWSDTSKLNGGTMKIIAIALLFLSAVGVQAQTAPTTKKHPIQHLVFSINGTAFKGINGTQTAMVSGVGIPITDRVGAAYLNLTVPSTPTTPSVSGHLGVLNYTRTLDTLIGKKATSAVVFDASQINITFQGGLGKILGPTKSHVAETFGVHMSYPLDTHTSIEIIGINWFHSSGPIITNTTNTTAISAGMNFSF